MNGDKDTKEIVMNFWNGLKKIVPPILGVVHNVAIPIASGVDPAAIPILSKLDNLVVRVQTGMMAVEASSPDSVTGEQKQVAVITDFNAYITDLKSSLGLAGKTVTYDENELKAAITSQHDAYTHFANVKASIKVQ